MTLFPYGLHSGLFVHASIGAVADALVSWGRDERVSRSIQATTKKLPLEQAWKHVEARKFTPDRGVLVTVGEWTGFFDNHQYEWLAASEIYVLCTRLKTDA